MKPKTKFVLNYCNGPFARHYCPLLSMEECFLKIEELIHWAAERGIHVTFSGHEWKPLPEKDELVVQISEVLDRSSPQQFCFYGPIVRLPRSAGGTWPDFDLWYMKRNKNQVRIL